jgi:hypothetical protein
MNGWIRLWVLVSATWLVAVFIYLVQQFPTEKTEPGLRDDMTKESYRLNSTKATALFNNCLADFPGEEQANERNTCMNRAKIDYERLSKIAQDEFLERLQQNKAFVTEHILSSQLSALGVAFILWVIPVCVIYLLGVSVAWVTRGFRNKSHS